MKAKTKWNGSCTGPRPPHAHTGADSSGRAAPLRQSEHTSLHPSPQKRAPFDGCVVGLAMLH